MKALSLTFFILTTTAHIRADVDNKRYYETQRNSIPAELRLSLPVHNLKMSSEDKNNLSMTCDPVERNKYITKRYHEIGEKLSACLGLPIGNWYHLASWASHSAGQVINSQKFKKLSLTDKILMKIFGTLQITASQNEINDLFASTNGQVAIEMIPAGEEFIKSFCENKSTLPSDYLNQFEPKSKLRKGFATLYQALLEKDPKKKLELIILSSIQLAAQEQYRLDPSMKKTFKIHTPLFTAKDFYRSQCTANATLTFGQSNPEIIQLTKDVQAITIHPDLINIENPDLIKLYKEYGIQKKLDGLSFKNTASKNWGDYKARMKFLSALFRAHIANPVLREMPIDENELADQQNH